MRVYRLIDAGELRGRLLAVFRMMDPDMLQQIRDEIDNELVSKRKRRTEEIKKERMQKSA